MTHIERELAEHLRYLTLRIGPRPLGSAASKSARTYVGEALEAWGYLVEQQPGVGVVARLRPGVPSCIQLRARLDTQAQDDGEEDAAGLAVLLALGRMLSQHHLRHGLEVVAHCGASPAQSGGAVAPLAAGDTLAAISFDGPGRTLATNRLAACGASAELATGARRLLVRYPEVLWLETRGPACGPACAPCKLPWLRVSGGGERTGPGRDAPASSTQRMREAVMLGAELVALLQGHTAATCRA